MSEQEPPKRAYINGKRVTYIHYEEDKHESMIIYTLPEHGCPVCGMMQCLCDKEENDD